MYIGILFSQNKEWNSDICSNVDESKGPEINQSKRETLLLYDPTIVKHQILQNSLKQKISKAGREN